MGWLFGIVIMGLFVAVSWAFQQSKNPIGAAVGVILIAVITGFAVLAAQELGL